MSLAHRIVTGAAFSCAFLASSLAAAQASVDRHAEQLAIVAQPGDPPGTYRLTASWAIDVATPAALVLDTKLTVFKNGSAIYSTIVDADALVGDVPGCGPCEADTICISGFWGVVCCTCDAAGNCECSTWINSNLPGNTPLQPGDVLTMQVSAASGAAPDSNLGNDTKTFTFSGTPVFWNRRLLSATLTPSPCPSAPDLYDLSYGVAYDFSGLSGDIPMFGQFQLILDGAVMYVGDLCEDNPWITTGVSCISGGNCGGSECGHGSCLGANVDLDCQLVELFGGAVETCVCSSAGQYYVIPGLSLPTLGARTEVKFALAGDAHSALLELPSLSGDDSKAVTFTVAPAFCPADINKDGQVDAQDLALVLGAWGSCN